MSLTRENLEELDKKGLIRAAEFYKVKIDKRWKKERIVDAILYVTYPPITPVFDVGVQRSVRVRRILDSQKD